MRNYNELDLGVTTIPSNVMDAASKHIAKHYGGKLPAEGMDFPRLPTSGKAMITAYAGTLGISNPSAFGNYTEWAKDYPTRNGSAFKERVRFWATAKSGMPACPFLRPDGLLLLPVTFLDEYIMLMWSPQYQQFGIEQITDVIPVFDRTYISRMHPNDTQLRFLKEVMRQMGNWDNWRKRFIADMKKNHSHEEPVSELDAFNGAMGTVRLTKKEQEIINRTKEQLNATKKEVEVAKQAFEKSTNQLKEETNTMNTAKNIATNMIEAHKDAGKTVAFLNAGRLSNKVIKTAMTPIIRAVLKPNFMQRMAMKITGAKDPVQVFLDSPFSDLVAAEGFKLALEIKGVEDSKLQNTADAALVYAGLEITKQFPLEDLLDEAIAKVSEGIKSANLVEKLADKVTK